MSGEMNEPEPAGAPLATLEVPEGSGPEPMTVGVALPVGVFPSGAAARIFAPDGSMRALQTRATATWPDGSARWLLCDFIAEQGGAWRVVRGGDPAPARPAEDPPIDTRVVFSDAAGEDAPVPFEGAEVEIEGPVRRVVRSEAHFRGLRFVRRVHTWGDVDLVRVDVMIHNPRAATHAEGLWDLGDPGSHLFRDLSLVVPDDAPTPTRWRATPSDDWEETEALSLFQASSGGPRWDCRNHVNAAGVVPLEFRGWRAGEASGDRAQPEVHRGGIRVALPWFWQTFPKSIESGPSGIRVGLFPRAHTDGHELQGGERKRHTVWLSRSAALDFVHAPRRPVQPAAEIAHSHAVDHLAPAALDEPAHTRHVEAIHDPEIGFAAKRELIDEYGWRHFGDLYGDHEAQRDAATIDGSDPMVSHYNNQYDCVEALLLWFLRTGDHRWWELAHPLACHVADVDVYHTTEDRAVYNGGLFWHSTHYRPAGRATHRTYTVDVKDEEVAEYGGYGGGPGDEHNYPSGLALYYWMTGDPDVLEAALSLAEWPLRMDDGARTIFALVDDGPTGLASVTYEPGYHGPGRGAGNSISAAVDGWLLTGEARYLEFAESLIRRAVHPDRDPSEDAVLDAERRWSYVVFVKYLLKYLHAKEAAGALDAAYAYGRAVLVRYVRFIIEHERPSLESDAWIEFQTETWPAQDLRKAQVVWLAAPYLEPGERGPARAWADDFFERSLSALRGFETWDRCRPLILTLHPLLARAWSRAEPGAAAPPLPEAVDTAYGPWTPFVGQKDRVKQQLKDPLTLLRLAFKLLLPSTWKRLRQPW
jgi:hypothetical protein